MLVMKITNMNMKSMNYPVAGPVPKEPNAPLPDMIEQVVVVQVIAVQLRRREVVVHSSEQSCKMHFPKT